MAFKPNYNFQKAERNRAKALKKQEKLAKRKAARGDEPEADAETGSDAGDDTGAEANADAGADKATGDA
jgi:hypothetical protein